MGNTALTSMTYEKYSNVLSHCWCPVWNQKSTLNILTYIHKLTYVFSLANTFILTQSFIFSQT